MNNDIISRDNSNYNFSVSIEDIDKLVINYIKENIDLYVIGDNNEKIDVPLYYASPDRFKTIQQDNFLRDEKSSQLILPVIIFKRNSIESRDDMPINDLDGNLKILINTSRSQKYFGHPLNTQESYAIKMPKFVKVNYQFIIFTKTIRQNNNLIESFLMHDKRYWNDRKLNFYTKLTSYSTEVEQSNDNFRVVKTTFSIDINGFILPEFYKKEPTVVKYNPATTIIIDAEVEVSEIPMPKKIPATLSSENSFGLSLENGEIIEITPSESI